MTCSNVSWRGRFPVSYSMVRLRMYIMVTSVTHISGCSRVWPVSGVTWSLVHYVKGAISIRATYSRTLNS